MNDYIDRSLDRIRRLKDSGICRVDRDSSQAHAPGGGTRTSAPS